MADVRVRNLDGWIVAKLKARAKRNGHSLEGELREVLAEVALQPRQMLMQKSKELRDAIAKEHGLLPDSSIYIREDREYRG